MRSKQLARISPTAGLKWSLGKHQHLNHNEEKVRRKKESRYFSVWKKGKRQNNKGLTNWDRWDGSLWRTEDLGHYHQSWHLPQAKHAQDGINAVLHQMSPGRSRDVDHFWLLHHQAALHAHIKIDRFYKTLSAMCAVAFLLRTAPTKISERFTETIQRVDTITMALKVELGSLNKAQTVLAHVQHNPHYAKFLTSLYQDRADLKDFQSQLIIKRKIYRSQLKETFGQGWRNSYIKNGQEHLNMLTKYMLLGRSRRDWLSSSESLQSSSASDSIARPFALAVAKFGTQLRLIIGAFTSLPREGLYGDFGMYVQRRHKLLTPMEKNMRSMTLTSLDLTALRYYRAREFPTSISDKELELHKSLDELLKRGYHSPLKGTRSPLRDRFPGLKGRPPHSGNRKVSSVMQHLAPTLYQGLTEKRPIRKVKGTKRVKTEQGQNNELASERSQRIVTAGQSLRIPSRNITMHQIQPQRSSTRKLDGTVHTADTEGGLRKGGKKVSGNFKGFRKVLINRKIRQIEGEMVTTPQTQYRPIPLKERGESVKTK
ncbi:hypothetical protein IQ07DRAFT_143293 [Pyrenochaeta sp. DS3sAY3a]|nr:hypothetical protein IQ07DRAFT_143293 [Pyrenochaeta sp. DS3sAY3a]